MHRLPPYGHFTTSPGDHPQPPGDLFPATSGLRQNHLEPSLVATTRRPQGRQLVTSDTVG